MSDHSEDFAARIRAASGPLRIRGGGSKDFYGGPLAGELLDVACHRGILAYEPTELVITARAGTPLAEIEAALAEKNQMLAFEPPRFDAASASVSAATLGGVVAAGLAGPRRATAGGVRDYVLGVKLLDGLGRELRFGGQVMKNVAGYDVSRLMAGSLGTLGLMLELSIKVLPRPAAELSLEFEMAEAAALETMNRWAGQPLPISATAWHDGWLRVRLSGARAAVAAAQARLGGQEIAAEDACRGWQALCDQNHPFLAGDAPVWRFAVRSTAPPLPPPGATLIEWNGAQRWLRGDFDPKILKGIGIDHGGHATLFRGGDKTRGVFQSSSAPLVELQRRVRQALDPKGVFDSGRLAF